MRELLVAQNKELMRGWELWDGIGCARDVVGIRGYAVEFL